MRLESVEALKQLVDLGYVAPPGDDAGTAVRECMAERHYNLARSHMDAGDMTSAAVLFQELIAEDAEQIRYYQHLFRCLMAMGRYRQCERMLAKLDGSCPDIARRAQTELKRRQDADKDAGERKEHERRREMFERRALFEKATGFVGERMFMRCSLLLSRRNAPDQELVWTGCWISLHPDGGRVRRSRSSWPKATRSCGRMKKHSSSCARPFGATATTGAR